MIRKINIFINSLKKYFMFLILGMIALSSPYSICDDGATSRSYMDGRCNFFITDLCIGLDDGDELKINFPLDYALYDLKFRSGVTVRIYVGFNPNVESYNDEKHTKCGSKECYMFFSAEERAGYILYKETKKKYPKYVHFLFTNITEKNRMDLNKFLIDIRKCALDKKIVCESKPIFDSL